MWRRREPASNARPPTANSASVAGSGVGTGELLRLFVRLPAVSVVAGFIANVKVLVTVSVELELLKFTPCELYTTEDDGNIGTTEFNPIAPESCDARIAILEE